jgi:hypothetical protein
MRLPRVYRHLMDLYGQSSKQVIVRYGQTFRVFKAAADYKTATTCDDEEPTTLVFERDTDWHTWAHHAVGYVIDGLGTRWMYEPWTRLSDVGAIYVDNRGVFYTKFQAGDASSDWTVMGRILPEIDQQALYELTEDGLQMPSCFVRRSIAELQ